MSRTNVIKISEREHILKRPSMYIGAVNASTTEEYVYIDGKIKLQEVTTVPGLVKIINEIIDNCVDVAITSDFKSGDNISVTMDKEFVKVEDNGTGIPVVKSGEHYGPELAWGHARAGSNFGDDENRVQIGMNGVGSFATNCFSTEFTGETDDGNHRYVIKFKNNASEFTEKLYKPHKRGTKVSFKPDLKRFGLTEIDDSHINIIKQRLINLSISYPAIKFKFNGELINVRSFSKYAKLFGDNCIIHETEDFKFAYLPNDSDDFRHFSYVNGLKIPDGGIHIDAINHSIVNSIRNKLVKKYKSIKPGDIRNKLMLIVFMKNMPNTKYNSQAKEKLTNSVKEFNNFTGVVDYDNIANKILRTPDIIGPITDYFRIKEEFKKRQELKGLQKDNKKIKSDKYLPSIGVKKYLMIVEGESALGGLSPVFGRKECGYYVLKGKPLNAYSQPQSKFTSNKELSELYKIVQEDVVLQDMADGDWYEIEIDGNNVIVNENDTVCIDGENIKVSTLI